MFIIMHIYKYTIIVKRALLILKACFNAKYESSTNQFDNKKKSENQPCGLIVLLRIYKNLFIYCKGMKVFIYVKSLMYLMVKIYFGK